MPWPISERLHISVTLPVGAIEIQDISSVPGKIPFVTGFMISGSVRPLAGRYAASVSAVPDQAT
ncbi:hypothetical protein GCM10007423_28680 [Dyadobacter endophyticus]|uniref:Uncharacterized protein n=1 Tax=Dyadobacter endophyticus TaxID=1749036 RepID=A0ABQ1YSN4_9BACT|nr:hypothetical protein GCM10007423_28680 [Dyadobacter endophyticus]